MPKFAIPLSDLEIKRAKPAGKRRKLYDGEGLFIEIYPNGNKLWRFRYKKSNGKENVINFGKYPGVSLADARQKRAGARQSLIEGVDPVSRREEEYRTALAQASQTFEKLARECHGAPQDGIFLPQQPCSDCDQLVGLA